MILLKGVFPSGLRGKYGNILDRLGAIYAE